MPPAACLIQNEPCPVKIDTKRCAPEYDDSLINVYKTQNIKSSSAYWAPVITSEKADSISGDKIELLFEFASFSQPFLECWSSFACPQSTETDETKKRWFQENF